MSRVKDMTHGNPAKLIFFFALPLIIGNLGQQIYMITDTVIVGQGVGLDALASLETPTGSTGLYFGPYRY